MKESDFDKTAVDLIDESPSRSSPLLVAVRTALFGAYKRGQRDERKRQAKNRRDAVSMLRTQLQVARIFVEGKALVPDTTVLMAIDITLAKTKEYERR